MKKNFVKKLALGLALVMAVTSVPASSEAAAAPGFKSDAVKVRVGQTKKYSTENSKKYSVKFKIGNKKVATIKYTAGSKSVKVTGVAEGKTTLRADFKSYKTKKVTTAKVPVTVLAAKEEAPVVVAPELASITQKAANKFVANFTADASQKFTKDSFTKIESADGTYTLLVKSVKFAADGKSAEVTTYGNFVDATVFDVTCGDKTASFTASVGAVKTAVIDTVQAEAYVKTDIDFTLYDANGIDVTPAINLDQYVTLYVDGDYYEVNAVRASDADVTLASVGDKVVVSLVYDPVNAVDPVVSVEGTITCIDTKAAVGKTTYFTKTDSWRGLPKVYLDSFKADATLYLDDDTELFYFAAVGNNGAPIVYDYIEVESSNEDVITVDHNYSWVSNFATINVTPQGIGTAKVVITAYKNDVKTVYAETVTVQAERRLSSIVLSKNSLAISDIAVNENDNVTVMLMDQYGNRMLDTDAPATWTAEQYDGNKDDLTVKPNGGAYDTIDVAYITGEARGQHIVEVTATDGEHTVSKKFAVTVKEANNTITPSFRVELSANTMDLNPEARVLTANRAGDVEVRIAEYYGTVFAGYLDSTSTSGSTLDKLTVKKSGKYFESANLNNAASATAISSSAVNLDDNTGLLTLKTVDATSFGSGDVFFVSGAEHAGVECVAANGTYVVNATITRKDYRGNTKEVAATANFTITNTAEMPKLTVHALSDDAAGSELGLIQNCVSVDTDLLKGGTSIVAIWNKDCTATPTFTAARKVTVKYVEVVDTFLGTNYHYFVPVSRTFAEK